MASWHLQHHMQHLKTKADSPDWHVIFVWLLQPLINCFLEKSFLKAQEVSSLHKNSNKEDHTIEIFCEIGPLWKSYSSRFWFPITTPHFVILIFTGKSLLCVFTFWSTCLSCRILSTNLYTTLLSPYNHSHRVKERKLEKDTRNKPFEPLFLFFFDFMSHMTSTCRCSLQAIGNLKPSHIRTFR